MARECWARVLGGCGGGLSREHYFSRTSYPDGAEVRLPGWSEHRKVSAASLTARILCAKHNPALSELDEFANAFRCVSAEMVKREAERSAHPERAWGPYRFTLPGLLFERWTFKVALNLMAILSQHPKAEYLRGWTPGPEPVAGLLLQFPGGVHVWALWANYDHKLRLAFDWAPGARLLDCPHVRNAVRLHGAGG
jgi:hypothetical protein